MVKRRPRLLKSRHSTFLRLVEDSFVELVDDGYTEQNTRSCSDSTHEVSNNGKCADAHSTESGGGGDVPVQDMDQSRITVSFHNHLAVAELLSDVPSRSTRNLDPGLAEESAGSQNKGQVKDSVEGIVNDLSERLRWRNVITVRCKGDGERL